MLGRALHTRLDLIKPDIGKCMRQCQDLHKVCHERSHKHHFNIGQKVWVRNLRSGHCWITRVVTKIHGSVSYMIQLSNGDEWQQHINQLRKNDSNTVVSSASPNDDCLIHVPCNYSVAEE